ncbi:MAG: lipid-A-disaccharide synthase [Bacteroidales bacterium]|nr:lipid-A-disaccharide synthase [Bacteroidales bacterium]
MKYYLIAGEASGDLHGSKLMQGLKISDPEAEFRYFGGDLMVEEGGTLVRHYGQTAVMGLFKVIFNLRKISGNLRFCKQDIIDYQPDALILIDYSGFNLRIAKFARPAGLRVIYYISPKVWVWDRKRVYTIRKNVDKMYVILPFEVDFYKQYDYAVEYVGNPIVDAVEESMDSRVEQDEFRSRNGLGSGPIIALLAGSRKEEIKHCLPEMLAVINEFPGYRFVIAGAPSISPEYYARFTGDSQVDIVFDQTYDLLMHAEAAVVTSGTATLETALFKVPEVVIYKVGELTYFIGRQFVKPKYFSLVNLILDREVVKEMLQYRIRKKIAGELHRILEDETYRMVMLDNYGKLRSRLGEPGAYHRLARSIATYVGQE